jgi:polar amino acid transport system substrate-binding protein
MTLNTRIVHSGLIAVSMMFAAGAMAAVTQEPGNLKVGMEITYPPFESYDANNNIVGADPELITAIAKNMGLTSSFLDTKFPTLIMGLKSGKYDVVISGMYITPERQAQAQTIAYAQSGASVLMPTGSKLDASSPEALCGLKLGLLQASSWVPKFRQLSTEYCEPNGKGAITVNEYPSTPEVTQALLSNNVQAQVEIGAAADMIVQRANGRVMIASSKQIYPQILGIYVKTGNAQTYQALLEGFEKTKASGEYAAILKKYNLEEVTQ